MQSLNNYCLPFAGGHCHCCSKPLPASFSPPEWTLTLGHNIVSLTPFSQDSPGLAHWTLLRQGPSMLGLGVEKLLEKVGRVPDCSRPELDQESTANTNRAPGRHTHMYTSTQAPSQRYREAFRPSPPSLQRETPAPAKISRGWTDKQGHSNSQGQLLPFPPCRDTQIPLQGERLTPQK